MYQNFSLPLKHRVLPLSADKGKKEKKRERKRKEEKKKKTEIRMTAGVLKQDPNTQKVQKNAIYCDKTQTANVRGNPLYQATKRHLNNS